MAEKKAVKPIRVGIWGLGRAGFEMHVKELQVPCVKDKFEIVAVCDIDAERLEVVSKSVPSAKVYLDGDKFLADKNIELVAVAVRSPEHVLYAIRALNAGKYVVIEKPIALTTKAAKKLFACADKFPGKLFIRQNRRLEPCFTHVREIIDSGILGDVYEIKLARHGYACRDDWQTLINCGGGQLNNWGPHIIDHALQFLDYKVKSIWSDLKRVAAIGDAEDHLKIVMRGESGRVVDIEISGGVAIPDPIYAVFGTRGTLVCRDEVNIHLKYIKKEWHPDPKLKAKVESPKLGAGWGWQNNPEWVDETIKCSPKNERGDWSKTPYYLHVFNTIRGRKKFPITHAEGYAVVEVVETVKKQNPAFPIFPDNLKGLPKK